MSQQFDWEFWDNAVRMALERKVPQTQLANDFGMGKSIFLLKQKSVQIQLSYSGEKSYIGIMLNLSQGQEHYETQTLNTLFDTHVFSVNCRGRGVSRAC